MSKQTELAQVADTITVNSGKIGIGTDSPAELLNLSAAEPVMRFTDSDDNNYHHLFSSSDDFYISVDRNNTGSGNLIFRNGGTSERMRIDSAGRVTMPYQPYVFARPPTGFAISTGTTVTGTWSAQYNVGNHFNTNGTFTAPITGIYQVTWSVFVTDDSVRLDSYINKNGTVYVRTEINGYNSGSTNKSSSVTASIKMAANDTITFGSYTASGTIYVSNSPWSYISVYLLG